MIVPAECQISHDPPELLEWRNLPPAPADLVTLEQTYQQIDHLAAVANQALEYADVTRVWAIDLHAAWDRCAAWARQTADAQTGAGAQ